MDVVSVKSYFLVLSSPFKTRSSSPSKSGRNAGDTSVVRIFCCPTAKTRKVTPISLLTEKCVLTVKEKKGKNLFFIFFGDLRNYMNERSRGLNRILFFQQKSASLPWKKKKAKIYLFFLAIYLIIWTNEVERINKQYELTWAEWLLYFNYNY